MTLIEWLEDVARDISSHGELGRAAVALATATGFLIVAFYAVLLLFTLVQGKYQTQFERSWRPRRHA
jgi:hypothetical protein